MITTQSSVTPPCLLPVGGPGLSRGLSQPMQLDVKVNDDGQGQVLLTVIPPESGSKPALDIALVIDTSGSMGSAANPNGTEGVELFSCLDLAKRGAEVVARSLAKEDTLTIYSFSCRVHQVLPRTRMTQAGIELASEAIARLHADGSTHLWEGLTTGLRAIETDLSLEDIQGNREGVVILLTDGQPTDSPANGEVQAMATYLSQRGQASRAAKLVMMGFGYGVNSKLLLDIANSHGHGNDFAFIPDGSMLLTNFVNLVANLQSTCARDTVLRISPPMSLAEATAADPSASPNLDVVQAMDMAFTTNIQPAQQPAAAPAAASQPAASRPVSISGLVDILGPASKVVPCPAGGSAVEIYLGDLLYGCERTVVLKEKRPGLAASWPQWKLELQCKPVVNATERRVSAAEGQQQQQQQQPQQQQPTRDVKAVTRQMHRSQAVNVLKQVLTIAGIDREGALNAVKSHALAVLSAAAQSPELEGLEPHPVQDDLLGQVSEALESSGSWNKWGAHYLRSLVCAHVAEACNNFKDPGVLAYGSEHSRRCRDEINTICDSLPVPVPSLDAGAAMGQPVQNVSASAWQNAFNNAYGGCFGKDTCVLMEGGGAVKKVQDLRMGDRVHVPGLAGGAQVRCVVTYTGVEAVRLPGSGLSITFWHPVRVGGQWRFPAEIVSEAAAGPAGAAAAAKHRPESVYNLVLEAGHVVVVDGVEACTLAHGFQDDVVKHAFFGTNAIIDELSQWPGWEDGWVELGATAGRHDPVTGHVSGYVREAAAA